MKTVFEVNLENTFHSTDKRLDGHGIRFFSGSPADFTRYTDNNVVSVSSKAT